MKRPTPPGETEHQFAEAFCLMKYKCDNGHEEMLWNSRNGVTPFVIGCRYQGCSQSMQHIDWKQDRRVEDHVPVVGDRIFADLTMARAIILTREFVGKYWDNPDYPMNKMYPGISKDEAAGIRAAEAVGDGKQPDVVEVTEVMRHGFKKKGA